MFFFFLGEICSDFLVVVTVDASQAGEGNLEITISARGRNIPTKVHPQGSARFTVSFVPLEAIDHVITITFNKEAVPGKLQVVTAECFALRLLGFLPFNLVSSAALVI